MSAIPGPGPSTLASSASASSSSSPTVPPGVRGMRVKKRVINLVNPADPGDFSHSSMSSLASPDSSLELADEDQSRRNREVTPTINMGAGAEGPIPTFTIRGVDDNGVKGILRQTGTPGSGNGVRFFPKNRFRVITPNHSLATPQPRPAPSLFSQLLAVVPPLSPLRSAPVVTPPADESWEQPGQEGEVSMIASSVNSGDRTRDSIPPDEDEILPQEDSWSGVPTQISSPLALPTSSSSSREVSFQELPSAELQVPDDMSNLLSTRFSPPPGDSFSMLQLSQNTQQPTSRPVTRSPESSWREHDSTQSTSLGLGLHDDNPTIRKRLSPLTSPSGQPRMPATPHSPTPSADGRPFRSIFADMSAEQADLSWPLTRPGAALDSIVDALGGQEESAFHSIALTDAIHMELPDLPSAPPPRAILTPTNAQTPRSAGNVTEYFDASSFGFATPCPKPVSTVAVAVAPRSSSVPVNLVEPAKALFEAQAEHTSSILAELALYRNLARTLQEEVNERDAALVDLNLRAMEGEMLRTQNMDLQNELSALREGEGSDSDDSPIASHKASSRHSQTRPGDRTTVQEAQNRDLEIRLAKSLADQEVLLKQLSEIRAARDDVVRQLTESRKAQKAVEERERDRAVADQKKHDEDLRVLQAAAESTEQGEAQIQMLREELREMKSSAEADAMEMGGLRKELDSLQRRDGAFADHVAELEHALDEERVARGQAEDDLKDTQKELGQCKTAARELEKAQKKSEEGSRDENAALQQELARLRSESASKDLEISSLQRRKTELKEDREMLNIALDSKQQELELLKRKYGVRGVAGSTPLGTSHKVNLETPAPAAAGLGKDSITSTAPRTTRKTSAAYTAAQFETPLIPDRRSMRHGVPLHASTIKGGKGMRGIEEELRAQDTKGSLPRRTRMIA